MVSDRYWDSLQDAVRKIWKFKVYLSQIHEQPLGGGALAAFTLYQGSLKSSIFSNFRSAILEALI